MAQKYYWPTLKTDIKVYIERYDIYLTPKSICNKLYKNLLLLSVAMY